MIEIQGVTKFFRDKCVLDDITLTVAKGTISGLVGRSGAGKSTLLRCINGLTTIDKGRIVVNGTDVTSLSKEDIRVLRKDIGMIFQQFSLLSRLSVYDNIALPLRCWKYQESLIDTKVNRLLEMVGIPEKIRSKPAELSGGQKQRVAIARALALEPSILLCDEATSALDPQTTKSILSLLNTINGELGITIVIVTHEMPVIKSVCEEIAILENGILAAAGPVIDVFLEQPVALRNLIGEKDILLPTSGINLELFITKNDAFTPVITRMARDLNIDCSIIGGEMESYRNIPFGSVTINVKDDEYNRIAEYLKSSKVTWKQLEPNGKGKGQAC